MYATARDLGLVLNKKQNKETFQEETNSESDTEKQNSINLTWKKDTAITSDPKIWGPAFWFTLHTSAVYYPENPSNIVRERMKNRILAIPYEVPCSVCRPHASSFIETRREKLDQIVSNRHELGKFYVDFHNAVNKRHNKPEWTYEKAFEVYSGKAKVNYLEY
jgi:hypothetical protein